MKSLSRRKFLVSGALTLGACAAAANGFCLLNGLTGFKKTSEDITGRIFKNDAPKDLWKWSREAYSYQQLPGEAVVCGICPHGCVLEKGDRSICRSKVNVNGKLYSLSYGNPCSVNVDPIEKKPLFHFHPHTTAFSIAAAGCNFRCLNCQNWQISQFKPEELKTYDLFPEAVIQKATDANAGSIAYTYSEAITYFEYMMDTARLAKEKGLYNLWISNGYINPDPLLDLCKVIDAANINLKSFSDTTYRTLNGGTLDPVLNTFKTLHQQGVHFELTTLVVPGYVDDPKMFAAMCDWILANIGPDHPMHLLRFFPNYKLDRLPPTPVDTLTKFRDIAMEKGIRYVYVGNVAGHEGNHTYCHNCKKMIVERTGFLIPTLGIKNNKCKFCGTIIPGKWS
jgi:pyruvate formate lyase activating enzyme